MAKSFIHFNRRDVRLRFPSNPDDPWFSEEQDPSAGFSCPRYHVTRAVNGPAAVVAPGDTSWLVGQLYTPWGERPSPTLDARIDVSSVRSRSSGPGYRDHACSSSRWFPLCSGDEALLRVKRRTAEGNAARLWNDSNRPIGQYLQRMRELVSDVPLREWEKRLDSLPLHFVSYQIQDGTPAAYHCVKKLFEDGGRILWDRWSLPRRLAEQREAVGDRPLDQTIEAAIHQADAVWGIESRLYGAEGSYAARERDLAKSLEKYHSVAVN